MTPADLRSLAADHQHIRHHPHEVAAALLQAAEWIEHHERRVADLVNVANAFAAETAEAAADAARYRWLRTQPLGFNSAPSWNAVLHIKCATTDANTLDEVCDAAMKEAT